MLSVGGVLIKRCEAEQQLFMNHVDALTWLHLSVIYLWLTESLVNFAMFVTVTWSGVSLGNRFGVPVN